MTATLPALPTLRDAYELPAVAATPGAARDVMAQVQLTQMRREQHPELTTWSPFDQNEPERPPASVRDGDAATWTRNSRSRRWRMKGFSPARHELRAGRALTWQELTYHYGPITAAPEAS